MKDPECIIWTPSGAWLQTRGPGGERRLSGLGKIPLANLEVFCQDRAIPLSVNLGDRAGAVREPRR